MAFISMAVFFLPADSTEKITVLLKKMITKVLAVLAHNFRPSFNCCFPTAGLKNSTTNLIYNSTNGQVFVVDFCFERDYNFGYCYNLKYV